MFIFLAKEEVDSDAIVEDDISALSYGINTQAKSVLESPDTTAFVASGLGSSYRLGDTMQKLMDESDIVKFYRGRSIFVTGATGFLGKATVEKLLRTATELKSVYILIRPNKAGSDAKARLAELIDNSVSESFY